MTKFSEYFNIQKFDRKTVIGISFFVIGFGIIEIILSLAFYDFFGDFFGEPGSSLWTGFLVLTWGLLLTKKR